MMAKKIFFFFLFAGTFFGVKGQLDTADFSIVKTQTESQNGISFNSYSLNFSLSDTSLTQLELQVLSVNEGGEQILIDSKNYTRTQLIENSNNQNVQLNIGNYWSELDYVFLIVTKNEQGHETNTLSKLILK